MVFPAGFSRLEFPSRMHANHLTSLADWSSFSYSSNFSAFSCSSSFFLIDEPYYCCCSSGECLNNEVMHVPIWELDACSSYMIDGFKLTIGLLNNFCDCFDVDFY